MRFKEFVTEAVDETDPLVKFYRMMTTPLDAVTGAGSDTSPASNNAASASFQNKKGAIPANQVSSYLASKGLDQNHILGILANIQGESGFQPGIAGDSGTSGGLFQHHASRLQNMIRFVGSDWQTDWKGQVDFALSEPEGQKYVQTPFRTPQEATKWWTIYFERPKHASADAQKRVGYLSQFA